MEPINQLELVQVGDVLKIKWPSQSSGGVGSDNDDAGGDASVTYTSCEVKVLQIKTSKKSKVIDLYNKSDSKKPQRMLSNLKYNLFFMNTGETLSSRLYDLKYKIKSRDSAETVGASSSDDKEPSAKRAKTEGNNTTSDHCVILSTRTLVDPSRVNKHLPPHRYILAPMVGASELPFRLLCRRYGSDLAYTPMMSSEKFVEDEVYRMGEFQTCAEDKPVVAHFSANNPDYMRRAALLVESEAAAIDLNLGCPQRIAHAGHFGSYLLQDCDRELVLSIVKAVATTCSKPIFVKIRLLDTVPETIRLCQQLQNAGASLITIHGRYRVNLVARTGAGARDGPAHLDQIAAVKAAVPNIPIIANGNIITWDNICSNLKETGCDGVMSAEGILDNPALFSPSKRIQAAEGLGAEVFPPKLSEHSFDPARDIVSHLSLAVEYLALLEKYPATMKSVVFHIRRMIKQELISFQLLDECLAATDLETVKRIVSDCVAFKEHTKIFVHDPLKQQRIKDALAKRLHDEGLRKAYEARMIRKAKREGKTGDDMYCYLKKGLDPPTKEVVSAMKADTATSEQAKIASWRAEYSQHCFAYHFGKCERDRKCAFLHADPVTQSGVTDIMEDSEKFG